MTKASENVFPKVQFSEETAPATPSAGQAVVYVKSDGKLYLKDDAGTETDLTASGGGGGTDDWVKNLLGYPTSVGADDTVWAGSDYSTDFTTVTVTGTQTVTEVAGLLSVKFSGQSASDVNAGLKAHTFSVGDEWVISIRALGVPDASTAVGAYVGIVFADGTTASSNAIMGHIQIDKSGGTQRMLLVGRHGTLTDMATAPWVSNADVYTSVIGPALFIKLIYQASNTFRLEFSTDGKSWSAFSESDISKTMTPSHVGVGWANPSGAGDSIATFGPLQKVA